jgi:hypothetical protein
VIEYGVSLISKIPPGTSPVTVATNEAGAWVRPVDRTPTGEIGLTVLGAEVVVVGRVESTYGHVRADGTWIETSVTVSIDDIVKGDTSLTSSKTVTFVHDGGMTLINDRLVQTENRIVLRPGNRYLLVLDTSPTSAPTLKWAWRVRPDQTLGGIGERPRNEPLLGGMKLSAVIEEVRRHLK